MNEPVAFVTGLNKFDPVMADTVLKVGTPLYTHPAKELDEQFKKGFEAGKEEGWKAHKFHHPAKTLTDEEIKELSEEHLDMDWQTGVIEFARAILRKAQE